MLASDHSLAGQPRDADPFHLEVGNPREFLQAEKEDQEMAEACKRLIKNCIIGWSYLYLSVAETRRDQ